MTTKIARKTSFIHIGVQCNDSGRHKDNVKDKLFGTTAAWSLAGTLAMQRAWLLSDAMIDCSLVLGHDEATIYQGGRAPCSADVSQSEVALVTVI